MQALLFYIFAGLTLLCALLVVANPFSRNPVTSAMFLVLTIASLAGIFILLDAFFLAAVQVLVYAGAVIVLFLFVIMLLSLKEEERRPPPMPAVAGGTQPLGELLFSQYLLPFEIVSVLLLVAMIGTVLLSKRHLE